MPAPKPRTGIIQSQIERDPVSDAPAPEVNPVTTQVDADTETVESRLAKVTSARSPFIRQAETDARRESNSRRLINSSIAAGAGREAAIRAALPVAQQDATTYTQTRFRNQEDVNKFRENRQSANLNKELAAQRSGLVRGEMTLGSELTREESAQTSDLRRGEATHGSQLTREEQAQRSDLSRGEATHQAGLTRGTATHEAGLTRGTATHEAALMRDELVLRSALTNEENELLAELEIKRDQSLSGLTREEQQQLSELEMKRDSALHVFDIQRDTNSSTLNERLATLESTLRENEMALDSQLKQDFETHMNDEQFSDEAKLQIVNTMNSIVRDAQAQMVEIGRTDRSAAQQAKAIALVQANRDAQLKVYQDLLGTFNDWNWGVDFIPGSTPASTAASAPPPPKPPKRPPTRSRNDDQRSCFVAGTKVICADGSEKNIEDIEIGDYLRGMGGEPNEVLEFDHPKLGDRLLYSINGSEGFVTAEHPFMTPGGWRSISPDMTADENPDLEVHQLLAGDSIELAEGGFMTIESLIGEEASAGTQLYNFMLSGNNTYFANGYLVHNKAGDGGGGGGNK